MGARWLLRALASVALWGCAVGVADPAGGPDALDDDVIVEASEDVLIDVDPARAPEVTAAATVAAVATCAPGKIAEVLAAATASAPTVAIDCHLTLAPGDVVTKRLILEGAPASGVTVDCRGAHLDGGEGTFNQGKDMIEVRSRKRIDAAGVASWEPPHDVTIRGCRITGSVRIWGMGQNGQGRDVRDSSRLAGHVARVRANAPVRVTLDDLSITGVGRTPLYIAPGVTYVTLANSELGGDATSVGIYLDAESAANVIRNNYLHVTSRKEYAGGLYTRKREEIAIDGSSYNKIIDNHLATLEGGGIYLYRNCGEGGTVRHSMPAHNDIINNIFYYDRYDGDNPSVFLGSRDNDFWEFHGYCGDDDGYPWGSSADDRSFARYNAVLQNQIVKRSLADMILWGDSSNRPNEVAYNETVAAATSRLAGCRVPGGYKTFILDGETLDVFYRADGTLGCTGTSVTCHDGELSRAPASSCSVQRVVVDCQVSGDNAGCTRVASCPAGTRIVGAAAACNLEAGSVTDGQLAAVPAGYIDVVRPSDNVSEGRCFVGADATSSRRVPIHGLSGLDRVSIGCREHDANGGDCQIRTALLCR